MCREAICVSLQGNELAKIVSKLQAGGYSYNPLWTPYVIAQRILQQEFKGRTFAGYQEATTFGTTIRLEKRLMDAGIGGLDISNNLLPALVVAEREKDRLVLS